MKIKFSIFSLTVLIFVFILSLVIAVYGDTVYVASNGSDTNPGTIGAPFATILKAISVIGPGDLIYMRGGVYRPPEIFDIDRPNGTPGNMTKLFAYPGEIPIIDGRDIPLTITSNSRPGMVNHTADYWHVKGIHMTKSPYHSYRISGGHHNIIEECVFYGNNRTGCKMNNGSSYNLVLNCDAYDNCDETGGDADGFGGDVNRYGIGNVYRNCRAWANSDDGWDFYGMDSAVVMENCWAFKNGWGSNGTIGDGNGFKLGPGRAKHVLKNCLAWGNWARGFDNNGNTGGIIFYNCTAYNNSLTQPLARRRVNFDLDNVPAPHVLRNCISYGQVNKLAPSVDDRYNNWNLRLNLTDADFLSVSDSIACGSRQSPAIMPESDFLKLAQGSACIDAGIDVGIPFLGNAPDLGAYESPYTGPVRVTHEK